MAGCGAVWRCNFVYPKSHSTEIKANTRQRGGEENREAHASCRKRKTVVVEKEVTTFKC